MDEENTAVAEHSKYAIYTRQNPELTTKMTAQNCNICSTNVWRMR